MWIDLENVKAELAESYNTNEALHKTLLKEKNDREPDYYSAPEEWNSNAIHSFVEGFLVGTGKDKVSELDDDTYKKELL